MAINPYFGDFRNEQRLLDDLTVETIRAMGRDVYYIPREYVKLDKLFGEDILSKFRFAYQIEMYVMDVIKFQGQKDVATKFGLDITDKLDLQVSITRFKQEIYSKNSDILKPREGDLIYFPLSKHLFEINSVEDEIPFYQFGSLTTYTIKCELFSYSNETIDTGITEVDEVENNRKMYLSKITLGNSASSSAIFKVGDIIYQVAGVTNGNYVNATYTAVVADFVNGATKYLYVSDEDGTLLPGISTQTVIDKNELVKYYVSGLTGTNINVNKDPKILESAGDNKELDLNQNSNTLFDFSETDPFSEGNY
jgi:hypothetical protein